MALTDHVSGTDICMACQESLADVLHTACGHRVLCRDCVRRLTANAGRSGRRARCPTCRAEILDNGTDLARDMQLEQTLVRDADMEDGLYPYAAFLDFQRDGAEDEGVQFADTNSMELVRKAVHACSQGAVPIHELRAALDNQLTAGERELAFLQLNQHVDLHQTLVDLNAALVRRNGVWSEVARHMILRTVEGQDSTAMAGRAMVSVAGDVIGTVACGVNSVKSFGTTNALTNGVVCLILGSVDVYRWSKGEISANELACNIGEHVSGCSAALGGAMAGAYAGAVAGPVGAVLGALLGGFLADLIARKAYRAGVNDLCTAFGKDEESEDAARMRAQNDAAITLGVDLQRDGFALAKSKFRRMILETHPDRARANNTAEDNATAARIIAAWQIVRGFYETMDELDDGDGGKEPEAFIVVTVMKSRQTASDSWKIVRTWFGEMQNAPVHAGQLEMVEQHRVFM